MAKLVISIQTPPDSYLEPLELALAMAAFDHEICLVFINQGLNWLHPDQSARTASGKSPSKMLASLALFNIDQVYCINGTDQSIAQPINQAEYKRLLNQATHQFSF